MRHIACAVLGDEPSLPRFRLELGLQNILGQTCKQVIFRNESFPGQHSAPMLRTHSRFALKVLPACAWMKKNEFSSLPVTSLTSRYSPVRCQLFGSCQVHEGRALQCPVFWRYVCSSRCLQIRRLATAKSHEKILLTAPQLTPSLTKWSDHA